MADLTNCASIVATVESLTNNEKVKTSRTTPRDISEVGWIFVQEYYTFLHKEPNRLHCFYGQASHFIHGSEGEQVRTLIGEKEINEKIKSLNFNNCKVAVTNVDCQASKDDGILIQVLGLMSNHDEPPRKFAQTFFLATQPNGYYVLNDIIRFLNDDDEEDENSEFDKDAVDEIVNNDNDNICLDVKTSASQKLAKDDDSYSASPTETLVNEHIIANIKTNGSEHINNKLNVSEDSTSIKSNISKELVNIKPNVLEEPINKTNVSEESIAITTTHKGTLDSITEGSAIASISVTKKSEITHSNTNSPVGTSSPSVTTNVTKSVAGTLADQINHTNLQTNLNNQDVNSLVAHPSTTPSSVVINGNSTSEKNHIVNQENVAQPNNNNNQLSVAETPVDQINLIGTTNNQVSKSPVVKPSTSPPVVTNGHLATVEQHANHPFTITKSITKPQTSPTLDIAQRDNKLLSQQKSQKLQQPFIKKQPSPVINDHQAVSPNQKSAQTQDYSLINAKTTSSIQQKPNKGQTITQITAEIPAQFNNDEQTTASNANDNNVQNEPVTLEKKISTETAASASNTALSIYVRGVKTGMNYDLLKGKFSSFGGVKHLDVVPTRNNSNRSKNFSMDDLNNDDFYNDDYYSALSLLRPSIQLDSDSTTTSETIMAVPKSSPVLTSSSQ
ncbi:12796_t:CDS:2 [Entrophospora sp. SA101]|nr:12796_t:CDS:2 [Entrophospora sp. SA101]